MTDFPQIVTNRFQKMFSWTVQQHQYRDFRHGRVLCHPARGHPDLALSDGAASQTDIPITACPRPLHRSPTSMLLKYTEKMGLGSRAYGWRSGSKIDS
jgi:hypothetical protein